MPAVQRRGEESSRAYVEAESIRRLSAARKTERSPNGARSLKLRRHAQNAARPSAAKMRKNEAAGAVVAECGSEVGGTGGASRAMGPSGQFATGVVE